jgi:hypothetical protein
MGIPALVGGPSLLSHLSRFILPAVVAQKQSVWLFGPSPTTGGRPQTLTFATNPLIQQQQAHEPTTSTSKQKAMNPVGAQARKKKRTSLSYPYM